MVATLGERLLEEPGSSGMALLRKNRLGEVETIFVVKPRFLTINVVNLASGVHILSSVAR